MQPINPYGHTKAAVEQILADLAASEPGWHIARLRYFNPVDAHPSGRIGEDPAAFPTTSFPSLARSLLAGAIACRCSGATGPRQMAAACAITSM